MAAHPRSIHLDLDGPVHVCDYGGDRDAPVVLCVHGLGNSHVSWRRFAAEMARHHRVLAVDLPGHGLTPRHGRSATVLANQPLLGRVIAEVSAEPVMLVGHSMGASLAILQAAAEPRTVAAMALLAPPMPRSGAELVSPALVSRVALCAWPWLARRTLTRRLDQQGAEEFVRRGLELTCASLESIDATTRRLTVDLVAAGAVDGEIHAAFVEAARSMGLLVARAARYRKAIADAAVPALVVQGTQDRLLSASTLGQLTSLQPGWTTRVLPGIGHSPHMEAPRTTAALVHDFLPADIDRDPCPSGPAAAA